MVTIRPFTQQKCPVFVWGAWRCTSTPSLASRLARLKYQWTTVFSFTKEWEKQKPSSIISQTTRCSSWTVVQYSTRDYSERTWVYSKKVTCCIIGKWLPNSLLRKKSAPFATVSVILSKQETEKGRNLDRLQEKVKGKWRKRSEFPSSCRLCFIASHERKCFKRIGP